ncbi:hypothetical protein EJB05_52822 [Eragrostis curvula]|uniref:Nascent polypeptide-associated complex subunit beta n=1 Tax=Eragrostis curvula TaxID=38414 RepID=A0A5J9SRW0_9POAL|nr:hypothetical protein EJB05_52822 [Eragrostis curvula]
MEGDDEYLQHLLGDPLDQFPPLPGVWTDDDLLEFGNQLIHGDDQTGGAEDMFDLDSLFEDDSSGTERLASDSSGTEQLATESSETNHVHLDADLSGLGYLLQTEEMNDASWEQSQVGEEPSPPALPADGAIQAGFGSLDVPAAGELTTKPDHEMEIAEMVRVAAQCGEDKDARLVWSEDEHKKLLHYLDLYAENDAVIRCFKIAFHLPKKTALDVALRCRWLQDKKKTAGKAELPQKHKDVGKVNKVKGAKSAKTSNKIYPLSEEALNSKSTKELIRDNNMFLKRLEENLKTGQLENTADYFYYLKTNMDAIEKRVRELGISMVMPPIDEQGLEEILRARPHNQLMDVEKLKRMAGAVRTGGKGSMRRKKKAVHKTTTTDDKRLQSTLKRIGVNTIPGIEEVNIFKDEVVIQFQNPKVQASIPANTWVVSGVPQTKSLQDMLPTIINQLGPDNLDNLRRLAEQFQKQSPGEGGAGASAAQDDDDDVPDLVPGETFEGAAEEKVPEVEEKKDS